MLPELPEDLATLSAEDVDRIEGEILAVVNPIREKDVAELSDEDIDTLETAAAGLDLLAGRRGELAAETEARAERARKATEQLAAHDQNGDDAAEDDEESDEDGDDEDPEDEDGEPADEVKETAVTAGAPRVASLRKKKTPLREKANRGEIRAAAGIAGIEAGGVVKDMIGVGRLIDQRIGAYRGRTAGRQQDGVVSFVKPAKSADLVFDPRQSDSVGAGSEILRHAGDPSRLPQALTADVSAGWCAPSETIYDLCEVGGDVYGLLDLPSIQVSRGGIRYAQGPDFSAIYSATTDWDWNEAQIKAGDTTDPENPVPLEKPCIEVPCPAFEEARLNVTGVCITGDILLERGYPEVVAQFTRGVMAAHAHKLNASKIAKIVALATNDGATPAVNLSSSGQFDDDAGVTGFLAELEIAAIDIRYRYRMNDATVLEAVLPAWSKALFRADYSRRTGIELNSVTDAQINAWFAARNVAPQWVVDWQDAYTGEATGPGGTTPLKALPTTVNFLMYAAGTFVVGEQPLVNLSTIYDSTLLRVNKYTALFTEEAYLVAQRCPEARYYSFTFCPAGRTGAADLTCAGA